ncbi:hypothetical protein [Vibrio sp. R78045]|uniref:hypothetical protein n=1 Tax=Vibrio sp. R78045 TaxID=3093868 RepID=UPI0036F20786
MYIVQVFKDFISSPPLQKLSTISDIATILGISIATLVAGPFLSDVAGLGFDLPEFLWAVFFYALFVSVFLSVSIYLSGHIKNFWVKKRLFYMSVLSFLLLFFVSLMFSTGGSMKDFFGGVIDNRYMLPASPQKAIQKIEFSQVKSEKNKTTIKGKVTLTDGADFSKYLIVSYAADKSTGEYSYMRHGSYKYSADLNASGNFTFLNLDTEGVQQIYLVAYRKADYAGRFPSKVTQVPSNEMDLVEAKVSLVKIEG